MPPKDQIINEEFEFPAHILEQENEVTFDRNEPKAKAPEVEIEIIDDTPPDDRGRAPLQEDDDDDDSTYVQEEELEGYSDRVKKRINQMSHKYHDERRVKEQALREREEAMRYAQAIQEENNRLKNTLSWGAQEFTKVEQSKLDYAQQIAEDKYRRAYESGDTEGTLAAHKELATLAVQRDRIAAMELQNQQTLQQQALQQQTADVYSPQPVQQPPARTPDAKADAWASRNPWFRKDDEMTSLAYGLHQKLVKEGYDTSSDDYYEAIDRGMRQRFPEKFDRPKKTSVVAPAGRASAPKNTIKLTQSQVAIAKRLGVPLEVYAQHAMKGAKVNG